MGIRTMTVSTGATIAPTGGSNMVFADDGTTVQNGCHIIVPATTDYRVRENATVKYRAPTLAADGSYSKDKKSITYVVPIILASGKIAFNTLRVEREVHPEFSAANAANLNVIGAQLLCDSEAASFWSTGSLS
jgi:hypothetical protein